MGRGGPDGKTWAVNDGRTFLIEAVQYPAVKAQLDALGANAAGKQAKLNGKPNVVSFRPPLGKRR